MTVINIHLGDSLEAMKSMKENQYDLAIVDPPYGIGDFNQSSSRKIYKKIEWNESIPTYGYFQNIYKISKNRIIWGANYYGKYIKDVGRLVHDKTGGGNKKQLPELSEYDIASHSFGVNIRGFRYVWQGNVQGNSINWKNTGIDSRIHPCQKPVSLYKWILKNYAKPGDKIFDSHGGSMSIAIACIEMGFDLDCWEIDEEYFDAAVKRIQNHVRQLNLFYELPEINIFK